MTVSENIRLFKAFPDDDSITGYLPISGALVRTGDIIYLEPILPQGYGVSQIKRNGVAIPLPPLIDERYYQIIISDCNDSYTVVLGRIQGMDISITQDDGLTYNAIFQS